jgi:hypothetical protein
MLDLAYRIDLNDPRRFPEFYTEKNSWDMGHLNIRGAYIFTKRLSLQFLEKL